MTAAILTQERLKELLHYDPDTGAFTWRVKRKSVSVAEIGGYRDCRGYISIGVDGRYYGAHRLAWLYMRGHLPPQQVDHKNGLKFDNRWSNLRLATPMQNGQNKPIFKSNRSGVPGASWIQRDGLWQVYARNHGVSYFLGRFDTIFDAAAARISFVNRNHTHKRCD